LSRFPAPPEGFRVDSANRATLVARTSLGNSLVRAGLDRPAGWQQRLAVPGARPGRGATAVVELAGESWIRIKQLRRGGAVAGLWRERFLGAGRLFDNLRIPLEASSRGVPTPLPLALMLLEGPPGLYRGWLGLGEITEAVDLATRLLSGTPPTPAGLGSAMRAVRRMHDAGVEHRDLNLGNLLLTEEGPGGPRAYVIDLDRARLHPGSLGFAARQAALRRLERSYVKLCAAGRASDRIRDSLYSLYAADDRVLAGRLARGRSIGRGWIRLHRLGWRR